MHVFQRSSFRATAALGAAFIAASVMWFFKLGEESFWFDEAFSARLAHLGTAEFVDRVTSTEGNMVLYHLLLRGTFQICDTDVCLRSTSVIASIGALFVCYFLFVHLTERLTAILAVVLVAFNGLVFNYAREARGYALLLFLALLSTLLFVRAIEEPSSKRRWIAYAVAAALSVYAHFYAALMLSVHALSLLGLPRERRPWRSLVGTWAAIGFMLIPVFVYLAVSPAVGPRTPRPNFRDAASLFARLLGGPTFARLWFLPVLILGPFFLLGMGHTMRTMMCHPRSEDTWKKTLLLTWATVPAVIAFGVSQFIPVFHPKYLIWTIPAIVLVSTEGIVLVRPRFVAFALVAVAVSLSLRSTLICFEHCEIQDWRSVAALLVHETQPGDGVVFERTFGRIGFDHYSVGIGAPAAKPLVPAAPWTYRGLELGRTNFPSTSDILEAVDGLDQVWLVLSMQIEERSVAITSAFEKTYGPPRMYEFSGVNVLLYSRT